MRILAIDYGEKRTGLAISDPLGITAQPLKTILTESLQKELPKIIEEYEVEKILLGYPLKMDGTKGPAAENMLKVHEELSKLLNMDIELIDERLSTAGVQKMLIAGDVSRARRKQVVDKLAATCLLQGYLDRIKRPS
ncbi:MAG: Holliday junction resolvase RuvX [Candidatus Margulisiibacteriota bacterium]